MIRLILACLLVTAWVTDSLAQRSSPMTFPQLLSTRYPQGAPLPAEGTPPPFDNGLQGKKRDDRGLIALPSRFTPHQTSVNADTEVVQAVKDSQGHTWLATSHGLFVTDGDQWWESFDHRDGMPYTRMTSLLLCKNGDVWGGTSEGAWRMRDGHFRYFWGKRWLPGNRVRQLWEDAKGRVWIATDGGTACIEERAITFAQKAAHYEQIIAARHNRRGYVTGCDLKVPGAPEKGHIPHASDNDGLWTAIYIAAESLRYAATKDPDAKALAKKSMDALLDLERLTGLPGFPARTVLTDEERAAGVTGMDPEETVRIPGVTAKLWFRSPVEKNVWCKGDTSSDEMDGHYFAWYFYHELVADDAEKKRVAATCRRVTDWLLKNNYTLVGHHGGVTRWGMWTPEVLNGDPRWYEERGLNSLEMLCYLKVAAHICQEPRYARAADELIEKHHFLINTLLYRRGAPWHGVNHSDDELAYTVYYPLILLEKDPARRRLLVASLTRTWEGAPGERGIRPERSPFYNFLFGGATGRPCDPEAAVQTLQDWPWELIDWRLQNSHRMDLTLVQWPHERNKVQGNRVLPLSERRAWRWNGDPWAPDGGGDGSGEEDAAAWLFPYWLGVYHGYIEKDR